MNRNLLAAVGVMACIVAISGCGGGSSPIVSVSPSPSPSVSPSPTGSPSPSPSPSPTAATHRMLVVQERDTSTGVPVYYKDDNVAPVRSTDAVNTRADGSRVYIYSVLVIGHDFTPNANAHYKFRVKGAEDFSPSADKVAARAALTVPASINGTNTIELVGAILLPVAMTEGAEFSKPRELLLIDTATGSEVVVPADSGTAGTTFSLHAGL